MEMSCNICNKFMVIFNSEIAMGQFIHDHILSSTLKKRFLTDAAKKFLRIPVNLTVSEYEIEKDALKASIKMRFIYMMSVMEAFFKEYISKKIGAEFETSKEIKKINSEWDKSGSGSKSLYNIKYSCHLLNKLFNFDNFYLSNKDITFESGLLRNCIVHNNGLINDNFHLSGLANILKFLSLKEEIGVKIIINDKLMTILIEDFRNLISYCDKNSK